MGLWLLFAACGGPTPTELCDGPATRNIARNGGDVRVCGTPCERGEACADVDREGARRLTLTSGGSVGQLLWAGGTPEVLVTGRPRAAGELGLVWPDRQELLPTSAEELAADGARFAAAVRGARAVWPALRVEARGNAAASAVGALTAGLAGEVTLVNPPPWRGEDVCAAIDAPCLPERHGLGRLVSGPVTWAERVTVRCLDLASCRVADGWATAIGVSVLR